MIIRAQSKEDAIEIVIQENHIKKENIKEVTMIKSPRTNIFGKIKELGTYEIIFEKTSTNEQDVTQEKEFIEVLDGIIHVSNPLNNNQQPTIYNHDPNVDLYINQKLISSQFVLQEKDDINIVFHDIEPVIEMKLLISSNKMEGKLTIIRNDGKIFSLKDNPKTTKYQIKTEYKNIHPKEITTEEILELLYKKGIKEEFIDFHKIDLLLSTTGTSSEIIAKGIPMIEGIPTKINYSSKLFQSPLTEGIEPIVEVREIIAEKLSPGIQGKDGVTITGNPVLSRKIVDINLIAGEGASLSEDGNQVISNIIGRPYLDDGVITVEPLFLVNGDFDNHMGAVNFDGDVIVKGNILDEVDIKATGNIYISGSVYNSTLEAEKSIDIGGKVISSSLLAGSQNSKYFLLIPYLEEINNNILQIFQELKNSKENNIQGKITIIYQYKYEIESIISNILKVTNQMKSNEVTLINEHINELRNSLLLATMLKEESFKSLLTIYNNITEHIQTIGSFADKKVSITFSYAQNSQINSSGDIIVTGKGSYQSNLISQSKIMYRKLTSVVKGGHLVAEEEIVVGIVGTPNEIFTECRVIKPGGRIKGSFYPGTLVIINNEKKEVNTIK